MATSAKKGSNKFSNYQINHQKKSFGYTIGDKYDLYEMTGLQKPHNKKEDSNNKKKKENP